MRLQITVQPWFDESFELQQELCSKWLTPDQHLSGVNYFEQSLLVTRMHRQPEVFCFQGYKNGALIWNRLKTHLQFLIAAS